MTAEQQETDQRNRSWLTNVVLILFSLLVVAAAVSSVMWWIQPRIEQAATAAQYTVLDPAPPALPITADSVIFFDSFEDQSIKWELSALGRSRYQGGGLVLRDNIYEGMAIARPRVQFDNFIFELYGRWLGGAYGGEYGVHFRLDQEGQNGYTFYLHNDGRYTIGVLADGRWHEILSAFDPAVGRTGTVNKIRIEALQDNLRFFVNDQYLVDVTVDIIPAGDIMLMARRAPGTDWMEVAYDNFLVARHPGALVGPPPTNP